MAKKTLFLSGMALILLFGLQGCVQQTFKTATDEQVETLLGQQEQILGELAEIRKMLAERPQVVPEKKQAVNSARMSVKASPYLGKADAPLTLVEFTDYLCPYCKRHANSTLPLLKKNFIESGKLKYVVREFPLRSIHPKAYQLSMAALCAGDQNRYWEMHDLFFSDPQKPDPQRFDQYANQLNLDIRKFKDCISTQKYAKRIEQDISEGTRLGVRGTPGFFLGRAEKGSQFEIKDLEFIKGAQPYHRFKQKIEAALVP